MRSETQNIKDPQGSDTKNDDVLKISNEDIKEAKQSTTSPVDVKKAPGSHTKPDIDLSVSGFPAGLPFSTVSTNATLHIPHGAFRNDTEVSFAVTYPTSAPFSDNTPRGSRGSSRGCTSPSRASRVRRTSTRPRTSR